jgi:hypothetical protein
VLLAFRSAYSFQARRNRHTDLYHQGICNENDGRYGLALHQYQEALAQTEKFRNGIFRKKISQRIRILETQMQFEKNFQLNTPSIPSTQAPAAAILEQTSANPVE